MTNTNEACCWHPNRQELHVNLLPIHTTLVLSSWSHARGITWSLLTDDGIETYNDPFTAPYFPIWEKLDCDNCRDYLDQIPAELMQALKPYRAESLGMLMLISQNKFLIELCGKISTLFWLLFRKAKSDQWSNQQFVNVCLQDEITLLQACHLPANTVALEVIAKFTADNFGQLQSDLIYRMFAELDHQHLNAIRDNLPDHLIQFLLRHPELQRMKLIQHLQKPDYHELLRTIRAIQHLAVELKIDSVNVTKQVLESYSISALKTLQAHLSEEATHQLLLDYAKVINDESGACPSFPQLSLFADSDELVQILSEADLLTESKLIQQNLMRYVPGILSRQYAVYQQLQPHRATAVYYLFPEHGGGLRPALKCLYRVDELIGLK